LTRYRDASAACFTVLSLPRRLILVSNHLPIKSKQSADGSSWDFEWDEDALIAQAHVRLLAHDALPRPCLSLIGHCVQHYNALFAMHVVACGYQGLRL